MLLIRSATDDDRAGVARVHVRSWQTGYRGLMPDGYLEQLKPEDRESRYRFDQDDVSAPRWLVASHDDVIVGFANFGSSRDDDGLKVGEIFALYVEPEVWGQGVGRKILAKARADLHELSFRTAILWVLTGNQRAMGFYEKDGWSADGSLREEEIWGLTVNSVRYRRALP
jgi:GNAT superfamily N-acetyltransferase